MFDANDDADSRRASHRAEVEKAARHEAGVSRRAFLRAGAGVALAAGLPGWLSGCATSPGSGSLPWAELAASLQGKLLLPDSPDFRQVAAPWALQYASKLPQAIAMCASEADVRNSLLWSQAYDVPLVARSGGHSYAGYSTTRGLMINVSQMHAVDIDPSTGLARLGGGSRNRNVYAACRPFGRAVTHGRCKEVGVAGLVLGGGIGFNMRAHGLTCDGLKETRIVLADGRALTCSAHENSDLFWACRGAGGGNFGINTGFTFETFEVGEYTVFELAWAERLAEVFDALQTMALKAPDTLGMKLSIVARAGTTGLTLSILGQLAGTRDQLDALLAPVYAVLRPSKQRIESMAYWDAQEFLSEEGYPEYSHERSRFVPESLSPAAIATILDELRAWPGTRVAATWKFFLMGGAIDRLSPADTAFVHRGNAMVSSIELEWTAQDSPAWVEVNQRWLSRFHDRMERYTSSFCYQNFIDPAQQDYLHAYYGANLGRLREVKRRYDPKNVFRYPQSIPV
ncbi:MAG: FAD-binding oxidoreductase [Xanthomonadaceae bacterium]|nr:FAD-binding oxidoreductase [Xanthomonadaceae bacterium]